MYNWNKISLFKFQQIDVINNRKDIDDFDKTLFSVCSVFNMTEYELDNTHPLKAAKLIKKVTKIFSKPFPEKAFKRIGKYFLEYDISKMTFGQYIELSFFLSNTPIQNAHYVLASISHKAFRKNNSKFHRKKSEYFLKVPVTKCMGSLSVIIKSFAEFNNEYPALFGLGDNVDKEVKADKFNVRYGWIYSASQVAEYERITLDECFRLPVRQAFNDLAYLKAKHEYETEQLAKLKK